MNVKSHSHFKLSAWNRFLGSVKGKTLSLGVEGLVVDAINPLPGALFEWRARKGTLWTQLEQISDGKPTGCKVILPAFAFPKVSSLLDDIRFYEENHDSWKACLGFVEQWAKLCEGKRFVPLHEVQQFLKKTEVLEPRITDWKRLNRVKPIAGADDFFAILTDSEAALGQVSKANERFVRTEQTARAEWFASLQPRPNEIQQEIAIRDETNALVVAGAGTGKTSTIITKVRYLVESGVADAKDILILSFNNEAAKELRERCEKHGINGITVLTFHALGLQILGAIEGQKPVVLSELESEQGREAVFSELIERLRGNKSYANDFARFVLLFSRPAQVACTAESRESFVDLNHNTLKQTLRGEWVRSTEEKRIADWLAIHGVEYRYEGPYPYVHRDAEKSAYRPDFTISWVEPPQTPEEQPKQRTVYLEHQALDAKGRAPKGWDGYLKKVKWQREFHQENGTTLIESFSAWFADGTWERKLREVLCGVNVPIAEHVLWAEMLESRSKERGIRDDVRYVLMLLQRALDLSRIVPDDLDAAMPLSADEEAEDSVLQKVLAWLSDRVVASALVEPNRHILFQKLLEPLKVAYADYKREQAGIDFEDMITLARKAVGTGQYRAGWSHYIVDEFQDASLGRLDLLLKLRDCRPDSRLLCVGDDWQSIVRFAGGDIRVMTEFEQRVGPFWRADLPQTYRFGEAITQVSSAFVLRNTHQLKKEILPVPNRESKIRLIHAGKHSRNQTSGKLLAELDRIAGTYTEASVFLLFRYNSSIPSIKEQRYVQDRFPSLKLDWLTAHRSKGREADIVIVGDLSGGQMGFPSRKDDDPVMIPLLPPSEKFAFAEERRLFYVAMTRARNELILMVNGSNPSIFTEELLRNHSDKIEKVDNASPCRCPKCRVGVIIGRNGRHGRFYTCSHSPVCTYRESSCPRCKSGQLIGGQEAGHFICSTVGCGFSAERCPSCKIGKLQRRENRVTGGVFWGCSQFMDEDAPCRYTRPISGSKKSNRSTGRRFFKLF